MAKTPPVEFKHAKRRPRLRHTMLRVSDLDRSLTFYVDRLEMTLLRKEEYPQERFTLAFVGYCDEERGAVLELTHNWDHDRYELGSAYGHVAIGVAGLHATCSRLAATGIRIVRPPGPMRAFSPDSSEPEQIAFIEDPDGYRIELIQEHP